MMQRGFCYSLNNFLDGFRGDSFRQTQFAEFEHAIHQRAKMEKSWQVIS